MPTGTVKWASDARLDRIVKELAVVNEKLDAKPARGRRLELLRRQAALGDARDANRKAARRALSERP